jgi:hypothetical protein
MTSERFARYGFEISGAQLHDSDRWVPYLEIRLYSHDQVDGEVIFPMQRVAKEDVFESEDEAIAEARRFAMEHVSSGEF